MRQPQLEGGVCRQRLVSRQRARAWIRFLGSGRGGARAYQGAASLARLELQVPEVPWSGVRLLQTKPANQTPHSDHAWPCQLFMSHSNMEIRQEQPSKPNSQSPTKLGGEAYVMGKLQVYFLKSVQVNIKASTERREP